MPSIARHLLVAISVVFLYFSFSFCADEAKQTQISEDHSFRLFPGQQEKNVVQLYAAATLKIENALGLTTIEGIDGSEMIFEVIATKGKSRVWVNWDIFEDGKMKIVAKYPESAVSKPDFVIGHKVSMEVGSSVFMGNINISGAAITGNNVRIGHDFRVGPSRNAQTAKAEPEPTKLTFKIGIPKSMLANLEVKSTNGDVEITNFNSLEPLKKALIISASSTNGPVTLKNIWAETKASAVSENGTVTLNNVKSAIDVKANTQNGTIIASDTAASSVSLESLLGDIISTGSLGELISVKTTRGGIDISHHTAGGVVAKSHDGDIQLNNPQASFEEADSETGKVTRTPGIAKGREKNAQAPADPFDF